MLVLADSSSKISCGAHSMRLRSVLLGSATEKRAGKRDPAQQNEVACRCEVPRTH